MPGSELAKILVLAGLVIAGLGLVLWLAPHSLGRLPGDFRFQRGNFSINFPLATCLLLSAVLSGLMWLLRR